MPGLKFLVIIEAPFKLGKIRGFIETMRRSKRGDEPDIGGPGNYELIATRGHFRSLLPGTPYTEPPGREVWALPRRLLGPGEHGRNREVDPASFLGMQIGEFLESNPPASRIHHARFSVPQEVRTRLRNPDPEYNPARYLAVAAPPATGGSQYLSRNVLRRAPYTPWYLTINEEIWNALVAAGRQLDRDGVVYIATDDDPEGEAIGWHAATAIRIGAPPTVSWRRARYHEITLGAIAEGFREADRGNTISQGMLAQQQAREKLDRLIGYTASRALWYLDGGHNEPAVRGLSLGRVQIAALLLLLEDEEQALQRLPSFSYSLQATCTVREGTAREGSFDAGYKSNRAFPGFSTPEDLVRRLQAEPGTVSRVNNDTRTISRPIPFSLATLQQEMLKAYGTKASAVLEAAQALYASSYCFPKGTLVLGGDGTIHPIDEMAASTVSAFEMDSLRGVVSPVLGRTRRVAPEGLVTLQVDRGDELRCTPNHRVVGLTKGGPAWIPAESLSPGDWIAVARHARVARREKPVSLLELLPVDHPSFVHVAPEMASRLVELLDGVCVGKAKWRASRRLRVYGDIPTSTLQRLLTAKPGWVTFAEVTDAIRGFHREGAKTPHMEMPDGWLPSEFWYLAGLFAGDGSWGKRGSVTFNQNAVEKFSQAFFEQLAADIGWAFPVREWKDYISLSGSVGDLLGLVFGFSDPGGKTFRIHLSNLVAGARDDDVRAFIAGLWDTDGHVTSSTGRSTPVVGFTTASLAMKATLGLTLRTFGIVGSWHQDKRTNVWQFRVAQGAVEAFGQNIAPWMRTRASAWARIAPHVAPATRTIPNLVMEIFDELREAAALTRQQVSLQADVDWWAYTSTRAGHTRPSNPSVTSAVALAAALPNAPEWVGAVVNPDVVDWVQIQAILKTQTPVEVYDISTTTESFIAEGFLVHNCTYPRTDSDRISADGLRFLHDTGQQLGLPVLDPFTKGQGVRSHGPAAKGAHEAIRPVNSEGARIWLHWYQQEGSEMGQLVRALPSPGRGGGGAVPPLLYARTLDMIWRRSLAALLPEAETASVTVRVTHPAMPGIELASRATQWVDMGFYRVWTLTNPGITRAMPPVTVGERVKLSTAPSRIAVRVTAARRPRAQGLNQKLTNLGIGTPATTGNLLDLLEERGYVAGEGASEGGMSRFGAFVAAFARQSYRGTLGIDTTAEMDRGLKGLKDAANPESAQVELLNQFWSREYLRDLAKARDNAWRLGGGDPDWPGLNRAGNFLRDVRGRLRGIHGISAGEDPMIEQVLAAGIPLPEGRPIPGEAWLRYGSLRFIPSRHTDDRGAVLMVWRSGTKDREYIIRLHYFYPDESWQLPQRRRTLMFSALTGEQRLAETIAAVALGAAAPLRTEGRRIYNPMDAWRYLSDARARVLRLMPRILVDSDGFFADMQASLGGLSVWSLIDQPRGMQESVQSEDEDSQ